MSWAIGAPGDRAEPADGQRFAFLVFANPLPGHEQQFDDWYLNTHLGDLIQLDGWVGAQRFRLEPVGRQLSVEGYARGYALLWDQEASDVLALRTRIIEGLRGGKVRKGAGFNYGGGGGGGSSSATYRVSTPRIIRPDGTGGWRPSATDHATPRPGRFMLLEMLDPAHGVDEAAFAAALDGRIAQALTLPGWLAAQRFHFNPPPMTAGGPPVRPYPDTLVIWEAEGQGAAELQDRLEAATQAGLVPAVPYDVESAMISWWVPISPYVTEDDVFR